PFKIQGERMLTEYCLREEQNRKAKKKGMDRNETQLHIELTLNRGICGAFAGAFLSRCGNSWCSRTGQGCVAY
ncbi:MAG TPA: hypothetical protein PK198_24110, partial [Saprospiraceae bacterium]|nr:hypothetical protein [Saprospiraceae bacterium]